MSVLDEAGFARLAEDTVGRLFERLEEAVGDIADVDLQEGILTVDFDDAGRLVLNKHQPNRQIWLASSVSGAAHYDWDGERWISSRGGKPLLEQLAADLSALAGEPVTLA